MEIKDRLLRIMNSEGLNSSAFADSIGVQRSSISHILSGRNKPSLDFLEKILASFPKYNAEWLVMGTGNTYKEPKQSSLFDAIPTIDTPQKIAPLNSNEDSHAVEEKPTNSKTSSETPFQRQHLEDNIHLEYNQNPAAENKTKDKEISLVIICYNDGTFSNYKPNH